MTEYAKLVVAVDSSQVLKAGKNLDGLPSKAGKAEKSVGSMTKTFAKFGSVAAAALSVREIIRAAEAYTNITNRLRLVTDGTEGLAKAQADLFDIAQRSRQPLSETAELYQRIAQNQKELNLTSDEVARVTETISKSLAVSGTSAASAAGAMVQLGQAFASGALRGDELNSVLESAPALAQSLAAGLGVTVGELRNLGQEGKLTAQNVVDALQQQAGAIDASFDSLAPTLSGAVNNVKSSLTQLVGKMDEASGASGGAAEQILELATLLQDPRTIQAASDMAGSISTLAGWLIRASSASQSFAHWFGEAMAASINGAALDDIVRVEDEIEELTAKIDRFNQAQESLPAFGKWLDDATGMGDGNAERIATWTARLEQLKEARDSFYNRPASSLVIDLPEFEGIDPPKIDLGDGGKGIKKRASDYASMRDSLEEQLALYGQIGEAAKVHYELTDGSIKGIAAKEAEYIMGLARELDLKAELTEQEKRRIDILRESGQIRAANDAQFELEHGARIAEYERQILEYEKQGNLEAAQRNRESLQQLETLRQIRDIQLTAGQAPGTVEGVSQAPDSEGPDAMFGGAAGEFAKLEEERQRLDEWRSTELEMQDAFLAAKAIKEEEHAERVRNIHEQHAQEMSDIEGARQQVALTAAEAMFGDMADMTKQFAGENSAAYKVMFATEKAIAIARSLVAIQTGIALAAANPFPANLAAMATVAASTAGLVSNIASISSFEGGGSTGNGPRSGGLDGKGGYMAMVHPKETIIDHTKPGGGKSGLPGTVVNVHNAPPGTEVKSRRGSDGKEYLDVLVADLAADGRVSKMMKRRFGLKDSAP